MQSNKEAVILNNALYSIGPVYLIDNIMQQVQFLIQDYKIAIKREQDERKLYKGYPGNKRIINKTIKSLQSQLKEAKETLKQIKKTAKLLKQVKNWTYV